MLKKGICFIFIVLGNFIGIQSILSQTSSIFSDYRFNSISTDEGLLQSSVLSMVQDQNGFIWMGTKYGLNKYDGYNLKSYKNSHSDSTSLCSSEIIKLVNDHNGDILIGTRGCGLNKYIYNKNIFKQIKGLPVGATVNAIVEDSEHILWVGTNLGFFKGHQINDQHEYDFENVSENSIFNNDKGELMASDQEMRSVVSCLAITKDVFLLGSENGLFTFHVKDRIYKAMLPAFFNEAKITSILKGSNERYYIGSSLGLAIIDSTNRSSEIVSYYTTNETKSRQLPIKWVNYLVLDQNNILWGGTRGGGLFKINDNGEITLFKSSNNKGAISDNVINSLLIDNTGVLWVGTESRGCNILDLHRKKFKHIEVATKEGNLKLNHQVTAITGNGNTIWIGSAFNGIHKIERKENGPDVFTSIANIDVVNNLTTNEIISLYADKKDNLWVGMGVNSLIKINRKGIVSNYITDGFVFSIHEDAKGNIWYGTWGNGFGKVNEEKNTTDRFTYESNAYHSDNNIVLSISDDSDNNLWLGTKGGGLNIIPISFLEQGMHKYVFYLNNPTDSLSLSNNYVNCICKTADGTMWIGTGNGLNRVFFPENTKNGKAVLQNRMRFKSYFEQHGLPNNVICGIVEDADRNLWVSTLNGLSCFNPVTETFTNYTANDGLQANEFHNNGFYKSNNNELYFGGVNGVTQFNPSEIKHNPFMPKVVITSFKIFDEEVKPGVAMNGSVLLNTDITKTKSITLGPGHKEFSLEFSGMHFSNISNVKYAYRLKGFNDEWRFTEKKIHVANYTSIKEGDYVFQVKATNNDGVWSDEMAEISIKILPPFYRSPTFFVVYILVIVILLFFFRKYSLIAITEKNKLKIESLERNKAIELTEAKMRFFTNISHEIRTPLTLIYSPLERIIQKSDLDTETKNSIGLIRKNVQRLLLITNQLLQLRKIDIGILEPSYELVDFPIYLKDILEYFEQQTKSKQISLKLNVNNIREYKEIWIDKEMITTALYNLISNSVKYSKNEGLISLNLDVFEKAQIDFLKGTKNNRKIENYLCIEVLDDGVGIPEKEIAHIFKRFYQSKNSSYTEQAGSGIGLSIVKEYVELHLGGIKASSQEGVGTSMMLYLPLGDAHIDSRLKKDVRPEDFTGKLTGFYPDVYDIQDVEEVDDVVSDNQKKSKLLLVDDDADMLRFLEQCFKENYSILKAVNGKEAWSLIQKDPPDLVLSDIMMPEMDGTELCDKIKNDIETSHIPVILLTAKAENDNIIEGYDRGADRYISKPFAVSVLSAQVAQLMATRKHLINLYSKKILLQPHDITITSMDEKFMTKVIDIIEENLSDPDFDVAQMVEKMNMSHSAVLKKIKALTDTSLVDFVRRHRLNKAAMIFEKQKMPVSDVAYMVGFSDPKYFSKCFSKQFGKTPTEYAERPNKD